MAYPLRIDHFLLPNGDHARPMRGSHSVASKLTPTLGPAFCPAIKKNAAGFTVGFGPVAPSRSAAAKLKFVYRLATSVIGVCAFQARPRFKVRFEVMRQSSCT